MQRARSRSLSSDRKNEEEESLLAATSVQGQLSPPTHRTTWHGALLHRLFGSNQRLFILTVVVVLLFGYLRVFHLTLRHGQDVTKQAHALKHVTGHTAGQQIPFANRIRTSLSSSSPFNLWGKARKLLEDLGIVEGAVCAALGVEYEGRMYSPKPSVDHECEAEPRALFPSDLSWIAADAFVDPDAHEIVIIGPLREFASEHNVIVKFGTQASPDTSSDGARKVSKPKHISKETGCIFPSGLVSRARSIHSADMLSGGTEVIRCPIPRQDWISHFVHHIDSLHDPFASRRAFTSSPNRHVPAKLCVSLFDASSRMHLDGMQVCIPTLPQDRKKHQVAICTQPLFELPAVVMQQWIEYHLLLGVEHFFVYEFNVTKAMDALFNVYESRKIVTRVPWTASHLPGFLHKKPRQARKSKTHGSDAIPSYEQMIQDSARQRLQGTAMNHCALKFGSRAKWMLFLDPDEYLYFGKKSRSRSLPQLLGAGALLPSNVSERHGEVCSYVFKTVHFDAEKQKKYGEYSTDLDAECTLVVESFVDRQPAVVWDEYEEGRTKFIIQPHLTELVGIHKAAKCKRNSIKQAVVDEDLCRVNHYYNLLAGSRSLPQEGHTPKYLQKVASSEGYLHINFVATSREHDSGAGYLASDLRKRICPDTS